MNIHKSQNWAHSSSILLAISCAVTMFETLGSFTQRDLEDIQTRESYNDGEMHSHRKALLEWLNWKDTTNAKKILLGFHLFLCSRWNKKICDDFIIHGTAFKKMFENYLCRCEFLFFHVRSFSTNSQQCQSQENASGTLLLSFIFRSQFSSFFLGYTFNMFALHTVFSLRFQCCLWAEAVRL